MQLLKLCRAAGLVKLGHLALDGTKIAANASRHKAMSYGRMREAEKKLARIGDLTIAAPIKLKRNRRPHHLRFVPFVNDPKRASL